MRFSPAPLKRGFPLHNKILIFSTHNLLPSSDLLPTAEMTSPSPGRYWLQWLAPIPLITVFIWFIWFFLSFLFFFPTRENESALTSGHFAHCSKPEQQQQIIASVFQLRKWRKRDAGRKTHVQWDWSSVINIADENNKYVQTHASKMWARTFITGSFFVAAGSCTLMCSSLDLYSSFFPPHLRDILGKT